MKKIEWKFNLDVKLEGEIPISELDAMERIVALEAAYNTLKQGRLTFSIPKSCVPEKMEIHSVVGKEVCYSENIHWEYPPKNGVYISCEKCSALINSENRGSRWFLGWDKGKQIVKQGVFYRCGKWMTKIRPETIDLLLEKGLIEGTNSSFRAILDIHFCIHFPLLTFLRRSGMNWIQTKNAMRRNKILIVREEGD